MVLAMVELGVGVGRGVESSNEGGGGATADDRGQCLICRTQPHRLTLTMDGSFFQDFCVGIERRPKQQSGVHRVDDLDKVHSDRREVLGDTESVDRVSE